MKHLILVGFIFLFGNSYSQFFEFNNPEDEKDASHDILDALTHLTGYYAMNKITKDVFVDKIEDGVVYLDSTKYSNEEREQIEKIIDDYVNFDINPRDKVLPNVFGFDSGIDSDYVSGDSNNSHFSKYNIKIDAAWVDQESTTMSYLSSSDIVYKKGSNVPLSGVVYKLDKEKNELEFSVEFKDGKKHGEQKQYSSLGFMNEIENYNNGKKEWAGARYSKTGMIQYMATNPDSTGLHFVAKYFYESTVESSLYHYINGKIHGHCLERYTPNQMKFEGDYDYGKCIGVHKYWYSNGQKKREGNYVNGEKEGTHLEFYENGQLQYRENYKNGKQNGLFEYYYKNGQLQFQGNYINGLESGTHKRWYENNGQLKEVKNYVNGKFHGKGISYYENGTKSVESESINGTIINTTWDSDGTKSSQTTFVDHKIEGVHYEWYTNGQMKSQTTYKNNKKNGIEKVWYSNGNLKYEKMYINDIEHY